MKLPQTIRGRLILWYLGSTIGLMLILGTILSLVLWRVLNEQIDHHLHTVIVEAQQVIEKSLLTDRADLLDAFVSQPGMTISLVSEKGRVLFETTSHDVTPMSDQEWENFIAVYQSNYQQTGHLNINNQRFAITQIITPAETSLLVVGYSLEIMKTTFRNLILIVAVILTLALLSTAYGGTKLLNKYLYPLEEIAATSASISHSSNLSKRIVTKPTTQELRQVVDSINAMITRLQKFFLKEHEFFSDAAHTLKTPLAVSRSAIENLDNIPQKTKKHLLSNIDDISTTIHDLLLISRLETEKQERAAEVSLSELLAELIEIAQVMASEKQLVVTSKILPDVHVYADRQLLSKALSNLIHNAINYTDVKGFVALNLKHHHHSHQAVVEVINSGPGIPREDLDRVFDRFYRGKNVDRIKGNGLGLAITKAVVERFHGSIHVESQLDKRTKFSIGLPTTS